MFKRLRIAVLLYVLLFVAAAQFFATRRATDWDAPLWVDIYCVDADDHPRTRAYLDKIAPAEFTGLESFLSSEARRHGVSLGQAFRVRLRGEYHGGLPMLESGAGVLATIWWSLRMRWLAAWIRWQGDEPAGDILIFALFHEPAENLALDRSTALRKGLIAVANLFADGNARGANQMVLAHELLHTLGATDKYAPGSNMPIFPIGYATPDAEPLLPQTKAELMAGRIPLSRNRAEIPSGLAQVVIGSATAREIGWPSP